MTKAKINRAIKHTGLEVIGERGEGCFRFNNEDGWQVGEQVWIATLNQLTLAEWVDSAEWALTEGGQ